MTFILQINERKIKMFQIQRLDSILHNDSAFFFFLMVWAFKNFPLQILLKEIWLAGDSFI